jgi:hypothetical protein
LVHEGEAGPSHAPLGVGQMIRGALGLRAFSVAPQVRADDCPCAGKLRGDTMPGSVGAWMPVQEQDWRPLATYANAKRRLATVHAL